MLQYLEAKELDTFITKTTVKKKPIQKTNNEKADEVITPYTQHRVPRKLM